MFKQPKRGPRRCGPHNGKRRKSVFRWPFLILLSPLLLVFAVSGCHRGSWHDPERIESRITSFEEDLEEDLEIRPDQQQAFRALADRIKIHVVERVKSRKETGRELKAAFEQEPVDAERVGQLLHEAVRLRAQIQEDEAIIDQAVAFYNTLDGAQQAEFNEKVLHKLKWWVD